MENIVKSLFAKVTTQLNLSNQLMSYFQISDSGTMIYIKVQKPIDHIIADSKLLSLFSTLSHHNIRTEILSLGNEEYKYTFEFSINGEFETDVIHIKNEIFILLTDLNEIVRSFYHDDFIISHSAADLLELGSI